MTLQHLLRTMGVVALAASLLSVAKQARAESGEGSSVYAASVAEETAQSTLGTAQNAGEGPKSRTSQSPNSRHAPRPAVAQRAPAAELKSLILRIADESGVPYDLAAAVVRVESRYNPRARNGANVGLTQINTRTAQALGYQGNAAGLFEAETNLRFGLLYLSQAYKLARGDTCGTILRFQSGHNAETMTRAAKVYCSRVKTILASAD